MFRVNIKELYCLNNLKGNGIQFDSGFCPRQVMNKDYSHLHLNDNGSAVNADTMNIFHASNVPWIPYDDGKIKFEQDPMLIKLADLQTKAPDPKYIPIMPNNINWRKPTGEGQKDLFMGWWGFDKIYPNGHYPGVWEDEYAGEDQPDKPSILGQRHWPMDMHGGHSSYLMIFDNNRALLYIRASNEYDFGAFYLFYDLDTTGYSRYNFPNVFTNHGMGGCVEKLSGGSASLNFPSSKGYAYTVLSMTDSDIWKTYISVSEHRDGFKFTRYPLLNIDVAKQNGKLIKGKSAISMLKDFFTGAIMRPYTITAGAGGQVIYNAKVYYAQNVTATGLTGKKPYEIFGVPPMTSVSLPLFTAVKKTGEGPYSYSESKMDVFGILDRVKDVFSGGNAIRWPAVGNWEKSTSSASRAVQTDFPKQTTLIDGTYPRAGSGAIYMYVFDSGKCAVVNDAGRIIATATNINSEMKIVSETIPLVSQNIYRSDLSVNPVAMLAFDATTGYDPETLAGLYNFQTIITSGIVYWQSNKIAVSADGLKTIKWLITGSKAIGTATAVGEEKQDTTKKPDPYEKGGTSQQGGGGGTFNGKSDTITAPGLPSNGAATTGFITMYSPTAGELRSMASAMWSADISKKLSDIFGTGMNAVIGLSIVPCSVPVGATNAVRLGSVELTGVSMPVCSSQYTSLDCGSVTIPEFWGSFLDYQSTAYIYLPYCGVYPLDINEVVNCTIAVKYNIDLLSGACVATLTIKNNRTGTVSVLDSFSGNVATQIPVTSTSYAGLTSAIIGASRGIVGGVMMLAGGPAGIAAGSATIAEAGLSVATASNRPEVQKAGSISSAIGALGVQKPYIILRRPVQNIPAGYNDLAGYRSNMVATLGSMSGFTKVSAVIDSITNGTAEDKDEIERLLKEGVVL